MTFEFEFGGSFVRDLLAVHLGESSDLENHLWG